MSTITKAIHRNDDHPAAREGAGHARQHAAIVPAPYFAWKGPIDRCLAAVMLVVGLPVLVLLVILVRLTSRGPGIYKQARVGKGGRKFMMYKIRSMRHDAEAATGPVWTQSHDPRVTLLGKVLRKLHLDELPQLFNVLKGEMSLVGPRPERPEFVRVLGEAIPGYRNRLAVLPGVTGLAQINLPPDSDLASVERKLVLDCEYIERGGLFMDLRLMLCTFLRIFKIPERWLHGTLGVGRAVKIPGLAETASAGGEPSPATAEATPGAILLQTGNLPEPAPAAAGESNGNGNGNGNGQHQGDGHAHAVDHAKHHRKRMDAAKPR